MRESPFIAEQPDWLPHRIDEAGRRVEFRKFRRETTDGPGFLANKQGAEQVWVGFDDVLDSEPPKGNNAFIFHSGFCRSTLLLHALRRPGRSRVLNEPEILNAIARQAKPDPRLADTLLGLLTKPARKGETVLTKPSNFPNRLIPFLLEAKEDARAIIITNTLREFLEAVARKGVQGRRWGRQTYLAAAHYAGRTREFDAQIPAMSDLQVAGLGWLLMQNWFQSPQMKRYCDRIAVVHSACFNVRRKQTITAASDHLGLGFDETDVDAILAGPVFGTDAKTGVDYEAKRALDEARFRSEVLDEEIEEVEGWIDTLASASGITAPVRHTLF